MRKGILIFLLCLIGLMSYCVFDLIRFSDNKLHITFCDVGQGDAIFIRTPRGHDIVIDGGADERVIACLSKRMPFWDRTIDIVILTHPHFDHYAGLGGIISRYKVQQFLTEEVSNDTVSFKELLTLVKNKKITTQYLLAGDSIRTGDGVELSILGPTKKYIQQTTPNNLIGETAEFASVISRLTHKDFSILLTGDSQASAFEGMKMGKSTMLHVPHHGSATGLNRQVLQKIHPSVAFISVGKKNRYNHPSGFILNLLQEQKIRVVRTDEKGSIEIVTDGKNYTIL